MSWSPVCPLDTSPNKTFGGPWADGARAEIRGFDGERKALVYDNYSKLIAATDTIRKVFKFPSFLWAILKILS